MSRLRTDIVAPRNRAQGFALLVAALNRLGLLVRCKRRLAPELQALGFRVGSAACRAVDDPASFELRGNAEDRKD